MPVINKIRIVNFIYDNGMKGFTNNTFEPGGKNTLFNLVNTGGKTVLLQLILQCILPGSDLGKRKFEDFFTDNKNTSYIMLEWRMDGIEDNYLLTGMCVTGNSNEDSKVNYFMFTYQYNNKNPWDIDNINAVKHNNTLTGYNEFKKIIQEQADIKIFKSNERRKYIDHLRTFNILELEWDTIKTINLKEGGVDRFFEKSAGSKQFIEYIVIPYIESIIYEDKSQANLLAGIFDRYIENLIKIPDLQSSINLYREFLSCGDNVVTEVRQYSVLREKIEKTINELFYYITYTWEQLKVLSEEIKLIDWQIEERQIDKENLSCRRASYDLFLKILELKDIQEKINTLYMDMNKLEKFIEEKQYTVNCSTGASLLRDIENWRRELSENKTRLENISRTGEDKKYLLNRCLFSLKHIYEKAYDEIMEKLELLKNDINSIKEEIKNIEKEQKELDKTINELHRKTGTYQEKIEKFNLFSEEVKKKYGAQEVTFDIDKTVNDFKEYIEYSREKTDKNNSEINSSELKLHDMDIEKQRVIMKIYDVENETRDIKGEIYLYEQKLQKITLLLSNYDIRSDLSDFEPLPEHEIKDIEKEIIEKNLEKENLRKDMEQLKLRYALIEQKIDDSKQNILKTYNREPAIDFQMADSKIAEEIEERIKSIASKLEELNNKKENLVNKSSFLKKYHDRAEIFTMDNRLKAIDGGIESYKIPFENLKEYLEERTHFYNDFKESIEKQKISVQKAYNTLSGNFGKCNEQAICNFISSVNMDSSDDELYNIHSVERVFSECIALVNRLKEICEHSLSDINRHKQELVKDCKREAEKFLNEINSIDSRSGINITGHGSVKMIKIKLEHGDEQTNLDRMNLYIDRCIEDIKKDYDENGSDRNKTYSMIKSMMSSLKLIEVISDINRCRVEVFKPHINQAVKRYEPWENVLFLSGGEKYTCFFAMYISLLSFIRSKKTCQESSFVILADNPFGSTTADHLLRVLFGLVKKYNTQMICFTALKETSIYNNFDNIYSLVLRNTVNGKQKITSEYTGNRIEDGFINFDQQLSLF